MDLWFRLVYLSAFVGSKYEIAEICQANKIYLLIVLFLDYFICSIDFVYNRIGGHIEPKKTAYNRS